MIWHAADSRPDLCWMRTAQGRALFGGVAAHPFRVLHYPMTSAIGLGILTAGHRHGWPVAEGGSASITTALAAMLTDLGGKIETGVPIQAGTVTLIEKCSGAVGFEAVATEHLWVVHISGGSVGRGDLTPDREAVGHLGSPLGRAEQMPSRPEVCGDAAEGGQEPLRMPRRFQAFHRPFALSGGLIRVLGAVVQIPRPPVLHRRLELAVGDLVAAQLVGDQYARHLPQAVEQLTEESLGRHRVSA